MMSLKQINTDIFSRHLSFVF